MDIAIIAAKAKEQRYTLAALERAAGLSNGAIAKWRVNEPSVDRVQRVADVLGTTIDELIVKPQKEATDGDG